MTRHSVTTRLLETGRYHAVCACGAESDRVTHKPIVEAWRKNHYAYAIAKASQREVQIADLLERA